MRKTLAIATAFAMVLVGFMALATPFSADPVPTIEKTILINGHEDLTKAWLGDTVTIRITVWLPVGMSGVVTDDLPDCLSYSGKTKWMVGEGTTAIEFDTLYDSAPGDPAGEVVTNTAYLEVGDDTYSASDWFTAQKYCYFNKAVDNMRDEGDGDGIIEVGENIVWDFTITLYNSYAWPMVDAFVWDRFGAEIEIDEVLYVEPGTDFWYKTKGKSEKVFLYWDIGDIPAGATVTLKLQISTDLNPSGRQEYTSPGDYTLNSGAVLKFLNPNNIQLSGHTDIIEVTVV
jgi:hypothetical protein